jgi:hypothetical protein
LSRLALDGVNVADVGDVCKRKFEENAEVARIASDDLVTSPDTWQGRKAKTPHRGTAQWGEPIAA